MARQELVRVEVKEARVYNFPASKGQTPGDKGFARFDLRPGGNNLAKALVDALEKGAHPKRGVNRQWSKLREAGVVVVHGPKESAILVRQPEGPGAPPNLHDRNTAQALAIVKVTSAVEVLELWAKAERRAPVKRAIEDRLATLGVVADG